MAADFSHLEDDAVPKFNLAAWRRLTVFAHGYRREIAGLMLLGAMVAVCDTALPLLTGRIIDSAAQGDGSSTWMRYAMAYFGVCMCFILCIWTFIVLAGKVATGMAHDLRIAGFSRLQELSFSFFDRRPVGWLVSRLTSDCSRVSGLTPWFLLDLAWGTSLITLIAMVMFWLNARVTVYVMAAMIPLVIASVAFQRMLLHSSRAVRKSNSHLTAAFNENVAGVRTTRSLSREEENLSEFKVLSEDMYRQSMRNALQTAIFLPVVTSLGSIGIGLALWRGGVAVDIGTGRHGAAITPLEGMTLGTLITFMQFAALLFHPVQELARNFTNLQAAQAAAERIGGLLETVPEIRDSNEVAAAIAAQSSLPKVGVANDGGLVRVGKIEFRNVEFAYGGGRRVLSDFNLVIEGGKSIALVGATGGGKSTIVNLLCRFYEPTGGAIYIDGVEYRQRSLHWLQSNLGVVLQSPHLFSGTIRENIRYGRLDATDAQVEQAARTVGAHEFITSTPDGYDSEVGEGGSRLSTGQKQLVALARVVLADPQILILDEATSSVDTETEHLIQLAVEKVLAGRISFVIAHRLSTIRHADCILLIDDGRIVEKGSHADLMKNRGRYFDLYTSQYRHELQETVLQDAAHEG